MERNPGGEASPTPEEGEGLHINSIIIPADDEQPLRQNQLLAEGLADRQQLVGGFVQGIDLRDPPARLYCNEDGKVLELPPNKRATLLLWAHNPAFRYRDFIVGDAFLVGPVGRRSADTNAPDQYVQTLFEASLFHVEVRPRGDAEWRVDPTRFDRWERAYEHAVGWSEGSARVRDREVDVRVVPES
jgi:Domain of unknown function (DUF3846)